MRWLSCSWSNCLWGMNFLSRSMHWNTWCFMSIHISSRSNLVLWLGYLLTSYCSTLLNSFWPWALVMWWICPATFRISRRIVGPLKTHCRQQPGCLKRWVRWCLKILRSPLLVSVLQNVRMWCWTLRSCFFCSSFIGKLVACAMWYILCDIHVLLKVTSSSGRQNYFWLCRAHPHWKNMLMLSANMTHMLART